MDFKERIRRKNEFDASLVYGTRNFNLMTGRDKYAKHRSNHDVQWIDPMTGLLRQDFVEERRCPLCKTTSHEVVFVKSGFPHVRCLGCSLVYVTHILNQIEYRKLWEREDAWETVLENQIQVKMQALEAAYNLDVAQQYIGTSLSNAICDVGCGPGTLLEEAKNRGYQTCGIEPNARCHDILSRKGIDCIGDFFPLQRDPGRRFDCIFILNTLEHLSDPGAAVQGIKCLLKQGGIIYITVPSIQAFVNRVMHEKAGVFGGHTHIQFFDIKTLSRLLENSGFEVLEYETAITELGTIKNYLNYCDPYFGEGSYDLDFLTPEFIYQNHLGRSLNMIARAS